MMELSVTEEETIRGLQQRGWSQRRVARETGHHRATIQSDAVAVAAPDLLGIEVGSASLPPAGAAAVADAEIRRRRSRCQQNARSNRSGAIVHRSRECKDRNAVAIYQDLVEHHGYDGAYNAVKRFVGERVASEPKISCRFETPAATIYEESRVMLSTK
jgi:hypothetical protein